MRDLIEGVIRQYSSVDLELFVGDRDSAYAAALRDRDQYVVSEILSYSGDSTKRTSMTFTVKFADGDIVQLPWSPDLLCEAFYTFCDRRPHLYHLTLDTAMARKFQQSKRKDDITTVQPGDIAYIDLRFFGDEFYESLGLPDALTSQYVMEFRYTHWFHKNSKRKIAGQFILAPHMDYGLDGYLVFAWGSQLGFDHATMTLMDAPLLAAYPAITA